MNSEASTPSLDYRSRSSEDVKSVSLETFIEEIGPLLPYENGQMCASAQAALHLPPLVLRVGADACTVDKGTIRAGEDAQGVVLEADAEPMGDLLNGVRSLHGLVFGGDGCIARGPLERVLAWDQAFQAMTEGRPLYEPGTLTFQSRTGTPLDLEQSFTPDDSDEDIAEFIVQAGFCRLSRWVDPTVLSSIAADVQNAARRSRPGDPHRWWATLDDGTERCVRVMYLLESSPAMLDLVDGAAYARLGKLFNDGHRVHTEQPQASEALIKPLRVKAGLTEFPWHRDCSLGGHSYHCAAYAIGLPLSATGGGDGYLRVVAGSHRVSVPPPGLLGDFDSGLPILALETQPGDLTIHVGCTIHGTKPPRDRERIGTYTTYSLSN